MDTTNIDESGVGKAAPWTAEDFDAERAWKLVENLRAEVEGLKPFKEKAQAAAGLEAEVVALKAQLEESIKTVAEREAEIAEVKTARFKEQLLAERGLPLNLLGALNLETEKDMREMADLLASMNGSASEQRLPMPDPVQNAQAAQPSGDALREQFAKQLFG